MKSNLDLDRKSETGEVMESSQQVIINNACEGVMEKGKASIVVEDTMINNLAT